MELRELNKKNWQVRKLPRNNITSDTLNACKWTHPHKHMAKNGRIYGLTELNGRSLQHSVDQSQNLLTTLLMCTIGLAVINLISI